MRNNLSLDGMDFDQLYALATQLVEEGVGLHHDSDELYAITNDLFEISIAFTRFACSKTTADETLEDAIIGINQMVALSKLTQQYNY
jgi:hypothetical protein